MNLRQRMPRVEDEKHRRFVAGLACVICGREDVQAAHVNFADLSIAKPYRGHGEKSDDCFVVPLCVEHHADQHAYGNERLWWEIYGRDPVKIALRLYSVSGDHARGEQIVHAANGS